MSIGEDSTKNIHNKVNDIKDWNSRQKKIQWKYSTKETNNKNNDVVPKSTEDKVYSEVVSPVTKLLPVDGPCGWNMLQQEMNV
jgi:hypothetical protein